MKVSTVNVLEVIENVPSQIVSFKDDKKGNKEAEDLFTEMAKENGANNEDMESYVEDGVFSSGTYELFLIHS